MDSRDLNWWVLLASSLGVFVRPLHLKDKETVPNNKFGKYALLIASTDSQEKRSWEKSSFPLKLCLYVSMCNRIEAD